jgi:hypothetical protein
VDPGSDALVVEGSQRATADGVAALTDNTPASAYVGTRIRSRASMREKWSSRHWKCSGGRLTKFEAVRAMVLGPPTIYPHS